MKSSSTSIKEMKHGRIIARAIRDLKVEDKKNMIKAVQRNQEKLEQAAAIELFKVNI